MVTVFYKTNESGQNVVKLIHHNPDVLDADIKNNYDGQAQVDEANIPDGDGTLVIDTADNSLSLV